MRSEKLKKVVVNIRYSWDIPACGDGCCHSDFICIETNGRLEMIDCLYVDSVNEYMEIIKNAINASYVSIGIECDVVVTKYDE